MFGPRLLMLCMVFIAILYYDYPHDRYSFIFWRLLYVFKSWINSRSGDIPNNVSLFNLVLWKFLTICYIILNSPQL